MNDTQPHDSRMSPPFYSGGPARLNMLAERSVVMLIFLYPILLLSVRSAANICFALLLAAVLYQLFVSRRNLLQHDFDRVDLNFSAAMISIAVATVIVQIYHGQVSARPYDNVLRFFYAIPIYLFLRRTNVSQITVLQYSLPLAALLSPGWLLLENFEHFGNQRISVSFLNPIHYGDLALMLGFLSLFSVNWVGRDRAALILFKFSGFIGGAFSSLLTGSRGGWIAIPVLALLGLCCHANRRLLAGLFLGAALVMVPIAATSPLVHKRVDALVSDIAEYKQDDFDTSMGARLQIWRAAIAETWQESPIFGLGPNEFKKRVNALVEKGMLTQRGAREGAAELHSDLIAGFSSLGLLGSASYLAIYLVPLFYFARALRAPNEFRRGAARLGLCFVVGFFVFGLTIELFNIKMIATFYALMVAIFLAGAQHLYPERSQAEG